MENDTAATNSNGNNATAKVGIGGKSNNHTEEEERSNLNDVEEHVMMVAEQAEEDGEEEEEEGGGGDGDEGGEGEQTGSAAAPNPQQPSRTPFTNLSQVDADLALARTLQEQVHLFFFSGLFHLFDSSCMVVPLGW